MGLATESREQQGLSWITKSAVGDFVFILMPGLLGIILAKNFESINVTLPIVFLIIFLVIDSGHVYTTFLRTHFLNKIQMRRDFILSGVIFAGIFIWAALNQPYLWNFVVYVTLFHQVRQHFGMSRWYQKINGNQSSYLNDFFLYLLLTIPIAGFHFRTMTSSESYSLYNLNDFIFFPNDSIYKYSIFIQFTFIASYIIYFLINYQKAKLTAFMYTLSAAVVFTWSFLYSNNIVYSAVPLFMFHGIPYLAVVGLSLKRTNKFKFGGWIGIVSTVLIISSLFGTLDYLFESQVISEFVTAQYTASQAALIALFLTPLLSHYLLDAFIWKRSDHDAKLIYAIKE